jgi:hypothetical protein
VVRFGNWTCRDWPRKSNRRQSPHKVACKTGFSQRLEKVAFFSTSDNGPLCEPMAIEPPSMSRFMKQRQH